MVATASTMLPLGTQAPGFGLPDTNGKLVSLKDYEGAPAVLVIFMCNHCPYVIHIIDHLAALAKEYQKQGVAVIGINSNDVQNYPDDRPEMMAKLAQQKGFTFPYLYDEEQTVAKAYQAACTPDFFVFDSGMKLVYRGQMDDSRPGNDSPVNGKDLRIALDAVLLGEKVSNHQKPSMGCNIKWK
ncbi:MAG: thioredoxin family protein [Planctomycetes bacterium]|nr:thioredoxin family protein [Planctomycetota bacterium]